MEPMRVLFIEDEDRLRESLSRGLRADGHELVAAGTGSEGLRLTQEQSFDVIVCDIILPHVNGFQICSRLREQAIRTPFLMLTAKDGEWDQAEALDAGADDYLTKPFAYVVLPAHLHAMSGATAPSSRESQPFCGATIRDRRKASIDSVRLRAVDAAEWFVAGEASAVVHWLERGIPTPTRTPPRLAERGLRGRPTLVQNVETLAHLALIARYGASWYREIGTDAEPGSMLVKLLGAVQRPGVYEAAIGTRVSDVLGEGGGAVGKPQALLLGGYFGSWAGNDEAVDGPFRTPGWRISAQDRELAFSQCCPPTRVGSLRLRGLPATWPQSRPGSAVPCVFGLPALGASSNTWPQVVRSIVSGSSDGSASCTAAERVVIRTAPFAW